jgi:predicted histone-like DNA-binding protein
MSKIIYDVYQNKNAQNAAYGKYFGRIVHTETLNTRKLARHIADHGSVYTQDVVEGVLTKAEACIVEMLLESKKIKLEGLGTFYLMAENKKGGAVSIDKFNPKSSFKGLHIRFLPDQGDEAGLNSKEVLAKATFMWAEDLKREKAESRPTSPSNGGGNDNGSGSGSQSGEQGGSQAQTVSAPQISGTTPFAETTSVSIQAEQGAEIRYTTDGSTPTAESSLYSAAITLSDTATVKAIAIKNGQSSEVASKTFTKSDDDTGEND